MNHRSSRDAPIRIDVFLNSVTMTRIERLTLMIRLAIRARRAKRVAGDSLIVGLVGRTESEIAPLGTIFVRNELWRARSRTKIAAGNAVRVTGIEGLTLTVEAELARDHDTGCRRS